MTTETNPTIWTWQRAWNKSRVHAFPYGKGSPLQTVTTACGQLMFARGESTGPKCAQCAKKVVSG